MINCLVIIIIIGVVSSSIIFYEFKKDDWRVDNYKEIEYLEDTIKELEKEG